MTAPADPPRRRSRRVSIVPPQHGAWAFLALPVATGVTVSPWSPLLLLLAVTWIAAYPASYFVLAVVRDRTSRHPDPGRFTRPLATWWLVTIAAGLPLLVMRPWLVWIAALYGASFVVNIWFARRHDERALLNDGVFIAQCSAMVVVTWMVAAGGSTLSPPSPRGAPHEVWVLTVAVALLLVGSTLHVKSLIRERADARYGRASRIVALASLAGSLALAAWWGLPTGLLLCLPFAWFAGRALLIRSPSVSLRPGRIGMIELVGFLLLVASAAVAQARGAA